jgi:hypothetical protein
MKISTTSYECNKQQERVVASSNNTMAEWAGFRGGVMKQNMKYFKDADIQDLQLI